MVIVIGLVLIVAAWAVLIGLPFAAGYWFRANFTVQRRDRKK